MNAQPPTVGEKLHGTREARGITLQEAAKATHIKLHFLQELENDHPELLYSMAQARGFLRLYASYLNLDARELMAQWEDQLESPPAKEAPEIDNQPESTGVQAPQQSQPISTDPEIDLEVHSEAKSLKERISELGKRISSLIPKRGKQHGEQEVSAADEIEKEEEQEPKISTPTQNSAEIFSEIGNTMRQRRERLDLNITDVEHFTNLKRMYLNAIEAGKFNELPSTVQGRGMLNNYAQFLGMEEGAVIDRYAEALQRQREERMPPRRRSEPAVSVRVNTPQWLRRIINPDLIVGAVLILALFSFIIWGASKVFLGGDPQPTDAPSISEMLQQTPSATLELDLTLTAEAGENGIEATVIPGVAVAQATPTVISTVNAAPLQVYIISHDRAHLRVIVDGFEEFNGRVIPDEVYTFSGDVRIQLKTGNAAALEVYFNQEFLGRLGDVGEVVEVDFSPEGLKTPTPQPTRTPTPDLRVPDKEDAMVIEDG